MARKKRDTQEQSIESPVAVAEEPSTQVTVADEQPKASREPRYNRQGTLDKLAGAELFEHHNPYLGIIRFDGNSSC